MLYQNSQEVSWMDEERGGGGSGPEAGVWVGGYRVGGMVEREKAAARCNCLRWRRHCQKAICLLRWRRERNAEASPSSASPSLWPLARDRVAASVGAESCGSQGDYPSLSSLRRAAYAFDTRIKGWKLPRRTTTTSFPPPKPFAPPTTITTTPARFS